MLCIKRVCVAIHMYMYQMQCTTANTYISLGVVLPIGAVFWLNAADSSGRQQHSIDPVDPQLVPKTLSIERKRNNLTLHQADESVLPVRSQDLKFCHNNGHAYGQLSTSGGTASTACWYSAKAAPTPLPSPRSARMGPLPAAKSGNSSSNRAAAETSAAEVVSKPSAAADRTRDSWV